MSRTRNDATRKRSLKGLFSSFAVNGYAGLGPWTLRSLVQIPSATKALRRGTKAHARNLLTAGCKGRSMASMGRIGKSAAVRFLTCSLCRSQSGCGSGCRPDVKNVFATACCVHGSIPASSPASAAGVRCCVRLLQRTRESTSSPTGNLIVSNRRTYDLVGGGSG